MPFELRSKEGESKERGRRGERGDVLKAMRAPCREFESRALSEIRALPPATPLARF